MQILESDDTMVGLLEADVAESQSTLAYIVRGTSSITTSASGIGFSTHAAALLAFAIALGPTSETDDERSPEVVSDATFVDSSSRAAGSSHELVAKAAVNLMRPAPELWNISEKRLEQAEKLAVELCKAIAEATGRDEPEAVVASLRSQLQTVLQFEAEYAVELLEQRIPSLSRLEELNEITEALLCEYDQDPAAHSQSS